MKQKKEDLVFCNNCCHYCDDEEKPCNFKKGTNATPLEEQDTYARPEVDNKHNNCPYYAAWPHYSKIDRAAFFAIFPAGAFAVAFESGISGLLALILLAYFVWRQSP